MIKKIRLGYAGKNLTLEDQGIRSNRTCRQNKALNPYEDTTYAEYLARRNLEDLLKILEWNEAHGYRFFRISSDIMPHMSNHRLFTRGRSNPQKLLYNMDQFKPILRRIGRYAREHGHRITFHPGLFTILNTMSAEHWIAVQRELWWHTLFLDEMGMGPESCIVLHGGGVYGDKETSARRWVARYNSLPKKVRRRIVLENDEACFSIKDVLVMSKSIRPYTTWGLRITKVPVVFDIFHHECYNVTLARRGEKPLKDGGRWVAEILNTWLWRPKMHISNQSRAHRFGGHSKYITKMPDWVFRLDIDLMLEAKNKELAVQMLIQKKMNGKM